MTEHKVFAMGFKVSADMPEDSSIVEQLEQLQQAQSTALAEWTDRLFEDGWYDRPYVPIAKTRRRRLREWLGRKLYDWALDLNPDLGDY